MEFSISEFELSNALSISTNSVKARAEKEEWPCIRDITQGGYKRSYFFDFLPDNVKARLAELWFKNRQNNKGRP